jgi:hypothetical protein
MNYYIYSTATNQHVATITGNTNAACEAKAEEMGVDGETLAGTYSPAFGCIDGLLANDSVEEIEA